MADLGTYHVFVHLNIKGGFIYEWSTAARYFGGRGDITTLDQKRRPSPWNDELDLFNSIVWQFTEGNYGCDCNLNLFLDRANQRIELDHPCGETLKVMKLVVVRPNGEEVEIYNAKDEM